MCHRSLSILKVAPVACPERSRKVPPAVAKASRPRSLFLLLRRSFLSGMLLRRSLFLGMVLLSLAAFRLVLVNSLLHLGLLLRQLRSLEALPVKRNLRDAHRTIRLPVPAPLLILLLALVM